jgi:formylglycine-generating enzyme required for sulfatase activity
MNVLGFYDLGGNASEWMWDLDEKTGRRVIRGMSWSLAEGCSVAYRGNGDPEYRSSNYGFRVALSSVP